jgi:hypothetical protein
MRSVQILKYFAYVVAALAILYAARFFNATSLEFWAMVFIGFLLWLVFRLFAIIAQLVYEIRNDSLRILGSMERALYYSNSLAKEIRDLVDSDRAEKKAHENTPS